MVFVNGQKFACERPLHEIKKKGRPSTQCPHCKELRKAKQVSVRCICGREEGAAAVANGLKRAKSLSHDGRLTIPAAIGGEDLIRSVSTQGQSSPQDSSSDAQSSTGGVSHCGCLDGRVCTCCRDRTGHVVVKPSKTSAHANSPTFKNYPSNRQRSAASLDLGKTGMLLFPRETSSPLPFVPHGQNIQVVQSPDSLAGKSSNGIYATSASPLFAQTLSPSSSSGCDHSPSTSSLGSHQSGQMQSHLCFDYASSSDYDSDHYNPTTSYSYFPETMASYPMSNASDDLEDMDMLANADPKTIMDGIMNGTTTLNPMESASADEIRMLYSALSSFDTASPSAMPTPPSRSYTSPAPSANSSIPSSLPAASALAPKSSGCCGSGKRSDTAPSTMTSTPSQSPPAGRSDIGDEEMVSKMDGCGCAISPNMCCCGERCACPGCLAYPNNQNLLDPSLDIDFRSTAPGPSQTSGCCGSNKNTTTLMNNIALSGNNPNDTNNTNNSNNNGNNSNGQGASNNIHPDAFNLSAALSLVQSRTDFDARQTVKQQFKGLSGLEEAKMQHPTLLGDNGVLICGCGCGRPTVDCAECFRDMCQFVGESQGRMMKDDLDFESALNGDIGGNPTDLGLNMNMPVPLNMGMNMNLGMDLNVNMANFAHPSTMPQTMSLLSMQGQRSDGSPSTSPSFEQQQQQQQQQYAQDSLQKQQQQQQQLALQMQQRLSLRRRFREGMEEEQKLQLQLMEQEQMQLQQLQQSMPGLDHLQLDFLDDEDWSFVDEIRTDATDAQMSAAPRS
ncbi:hypothetical protein BGX23_006283 [Mortierella sp. AD031]|nr:hypothetical protein BGX23_006283 [Mortierella sp. AD031]KAG0218532.1 hypothetical protein BGX33_006852 [Mortierella sp. NVP41]